MKPNDHIEYVFDEATGLYCRVTASTRFTVVFARQCQASLLFALVPGPCVCVTSRAEFIVEASRAAVAFVDSELLELVDGSSSVPIVAIVDDGPTQVLAATVRLLGAFPWLAHVASTAMLSGPHARAHVALLLERLAAGPEHRMLGEAGVGRVALLARASRREARFERIRDFFTRHGLSARAIAAINDVFEELVTNALYDAPLEAGYFTEAVPRTEDVDLPRERACEISYGIEDGFAFVRVCDTFGALTRARLSSVLKRCTAKSVPIDESRGGAGLGLWRVFSIASTIAITVHPGQLTDIVVGISTKNGRVVTKQLQAVQLFFGAEKSPGFVDSYIPETERDLFDHSVTLVAMA